MATLFTLVLFAALAAFVYALIKPAWFTKVTKKAWSRGKISLAFGSTIFILLVLIGLTAPPVETKEPVTNTSSTETIEQRDTKTAEQAATEPLITTETLTETQAVPFSKTTVNDSSRNKGSSAITTAGVDGVKTLTYEVTKKDSKETGRTLVGEAVTRQPVTEVTSVGTKIAAQPKPAAKSNCDPNYSPCIPNVSYDLDCGDIGFTVSVIGSDPHRLDRDNDGYGCE